MGISFLFCLSYIYLWKILKKDTPASGFGYILIFHLILISYIFKLNILSNEFKIILIVTSSIYWLDDLNNLSSKLRIILQFISGFLIGYYSLKNSNISIDNQKIFFITLAVSGLICIFFTNIINFYDGLDLNVSILIILISLIFLLNVNLDMESINIWLIVLSFTIGFMLLNIFPNNVYFGDSGCFIIACLLDIFLIKLISTQNLEVFYFLIPFALPIFDVFFVIAKRLILGEKLTSRNYHHLYHIIEKKFSSKIYLIPQVVNFALLYVLSLFIVNGSLKNYFIFLSLCFLITGIHYFFLRSILKKY